MWLLLLRIAATPPFVFAASTQSPCLLAAIRERRPARRRVSGWRGRSPERAPTWSTVWHNEEQRGGLVVYGQQHGAATALAAGAKATEVFLARRMLFRADETRITTQFARLHYPRNWHYDHLGGLQPMVEVGAITNDRCSAALDLLGSQRLHDGGWAVVSPFYATSPGGKKPLDGVEWGNQGPGQLNEWITVDALAVLQAAGRLSS